MDDNRIARTYRVARIFADATYSGTTVYTTCFAGCYKDFDNLKDAYKWLSHNCRLESVEHLIVYVIDTITCTEHNILLL